MSEQNEQLGVTVSIRAIGPTFLYSGHHDYSLSLANFLKFEKALAATALQLGEEYAAEAASPPATKPAKA